MATKKNVEINGQEYFRIRRKIDGKMKSFYGSSKGDAEKKFREYLEKQAEEKHQEQIITDTASFGMRAEEYVTNTLRVSDKYATATKYQYELSYNKYVKNSALTDLVLAKVRPSDIQAFYNSLDVSKQTIHRLHKFMVNFCKWAQRNDYCTDFMSAVEIPKKFDNSRHDEIIVWEEDEVRRILECMDAPVRLSQRHRLVFFVKVLLYTGARLSEAIALKYSDIEDDTITIQRQYYLQEMKPPKYGSTRQIPMHEELRSAFEAHKEWHQYDMEKNKYKTEYIFTASTGKLYDPVNIRRALKRFYASNDIPYKHPHAYRATFCTQLCKCGVPLEVAASLMGHKSMEVTAAHYALVRSETKRDAIDKLTYEKDPGGTGA